MGVSNFNPATGTVTPGTTNQIAGYTGSGNTLGGLTLGTNLSITSGTLNATAGSGSGTVSAGTPAQIAAYTGTGATVGGLTIVGGNAAVSGGNIQINTPNVTTLTALYAIPLALRTPLMLVAVTAGDGSLWQWNGGTTLTSTDWVQAGPFQMQLNGAGPVNRGAINFIPTTGVGVALADNSGADRADATLSLLPAATVPVLGAFNALAYGADPTGVADATSAIQAALTAASTTGAQVLVPPGNYLIAGQLTIPAGVQFVGSGVAPVIVAGNPPTGGTQLWITGNPGNPTGPAAVSMGQSGAGVMRGFTIYYPNQLNTATTPTTYPYAIAITSTTTPQATCTVEDCSLINPYQGILVNNVTRANIRRITGQPLSMGISVQGISDVCRIADIQFVFLWAWVGTNAQTWQQANGTAFQFGRSDEQICNNLFAIGYNVGVEFFNQTTGINTGTTYGTFHGCSLDLVNTGVLCTAVGGASGDGVTWIGGGIEAITAAVSLASGPLSFVGTRFFSSGTPAVTHTGGDLAFQACRFQSAHPMTSSGNVFSLNGNVFAVSSTIALSGTGQAMLVGNVPPSGVSFASLVSGSMSGGTSIVPGGAVSGESDWPSIPLIGDSFGGSAATLITAHTADSGATWPSDSSHQAGGTSGATDIQLNGTGGIFLANADSANIPSTTMPATPFEVIFGYGRKTALTSAQTVALTLFAQFSGGFGEGMSFHAREPGDANTGMWFGTAASHSVAIVPLPSVGTPVLIRIRVYASGSNTIFEGASSPVFSPSGSPVWSDLGMTVTVATSTLTQPVNIGPYFQDVLGSGGWTASTGPYFFGPFIVRALG